MAGKRQFGIIAAMTTPFAAEAIDVDRLCRHAIRVLDQGCSGVGLFGTTGEGPSIGLGERKAVLEALKSHGVASEKLVFGITVSAVEDALAQARLAEEFGISSLLVTPPHYFKDVAPAAVRDWFGAFIGALPQSGPGVILYNIPQVTGVPILPETVEALVAEFPGRIQGVKDSSGSWESVEHFLGRFPDLAVLAGDERLLEKAVKLGAAGSISGVANFLPDRLAAIMSGSPADPGLCALVDAVVAHPATSAVKALVAHTTGYAGWRTVRPPLTALSDAEAKALAATYDRLYS